jgi:hypothetical protein
VLKGPKGPKGPKAALAWPPLEALIWQLPPELGLGLWLAQARQMQVKVLLRVLLRVRRRQSRLP